MRINKNKADVPLSQDYLSFIRKNQQIIKQFQEISLSKPSATLLHRSISNIGNYSGTPDGPSIFSDSTLINRGECRYKSMPSKPKMGVDGYGKPEFILCKDKNEMENISKSTNIEKDIKIMKNEFKNGRSNHERKSSLKEASSELKFPKISGYVDPSSIKIKIRDYKSNSETHLTVEKLLMSHNEEKTVLERRKAESYRHSDNQIRNKANEAKLSEINKGNVSNKEIQNYYDMESLIEIKEKVLNFLPIFKSLKSQKREKTCEREEDSQEELNQFLEANMIKRYTKKLSTKTKNRFKEVKEELEAKNYKTVTPEVASSIQEEAVKNIEEEESKPEKPQSTSKSPSKTTRNKSKRPIKFVISNPHSEESTVYQNKIAAYREFLFMVNFAHRVFDPLIVVEDPEKHRIESKYKYYIGHGNNGLLVQSLMKRRFWWVRVNDPKEANFVWTQLKLNNYFQFQTKAELSEKYDKLESDYPPLDSEKKIKKNKMDNKKPEQPRIGSILRGQLPESEKKIFTSADCYHMMQMYEKAYLQNPQLKNIQKIESRINYFPNNFLNKRSEDPSSIRMQNHFMCNYEIGNKKALFYNLRHYYELIGVKPFTKIPLTFHIKKGLTDPEYAKFFQEYKKIKIEIEQSIKEKASKKLRSKNIWIVKPGELSNRGNGITVINQIPQLTKILKNKEKGNENLERTFIVQKYIERPFLYKNRKFDIRHYMMISRLHGRMRAYWFSEGYIRTSSYEYDLDEVSDISIHLTNDAIQKNCEEYGKFEEGNKLSYNEFQKYLDSAYPEKKYSFIEGIYPKMRQTATDAVKSTYLWMDPQQLNHNFEIFGLDFMIDANFNVWLIEVNTNPCLELSSGLLSRIIPTMIENSLRLSIDPIFPPTAHYLNSTKYLAPDSPMERLQYELIFDESRDGKEIVELMEKKGKPDMGSIDEEDEVYEDDGDEIELKGDIE